MVASPGERTGRTQQQPNAKKKEEVTLGQILERRSGWGKRENMILTERGSLALALDLAKRFPPNQLYNYANHAKDVNREVRCARKLLPCLYDVQSCFIAPIFS